MASHAASASAAAASSIDTADLVFVARELARHIGAIARVLVDRARLGHADREALVESLSSECATDKERAAFVAACRKQFSGVRTPARR